MVDALISRWQSKFLNERTRAELEKELLHNVRQAAAQISDPADFLDWIRKHKTYRFLVHEAQAEGLCSKPRELSAYILERILREQWEEYG